MRFDELTLRQFKCYDDESVSFDPGVTVIHGVNGSGKSSLLDASFFALYGSDALTGTLDEIVTTGEDETEVALSITHDGEPYAVYRHVRFSGDRAQTATCELELPGDTISGARAVRSEIASLLRMDADAFLNCAYVRQGEVNKLIHASPRERQDMIDELLQLGVLETYRDRAVHARRGISSLRDEYAGQIAGIKEQIQRKEADDLGATLNRLETERDSIDRELEELDSNVEEAEEARGDAEAVLERFEERQEEVDRLAEDIEDIQSAIRTTTEERETLAEEIAEHVEERADVQDDLTVARSEFEADLSSVDLAETHREELHERDEALREEIEEARIELTEHRGTVDEADARITELQSRVQDLADTIEARRETIKSARAELEERREALSSLRDSRTTLEEQISEAGYDDIDDAHEEVQDRQAALAEREQELRTRIDAREDDIDEMEALVEAGKCPTCGQDVCDAPAVDSLDEARTQLTTLESTLEDVREERETVDEEAERIASLREDAEECTRLDDRISSVEELIEEKESRIDERQDSIDELQNEIAEAEEAIETARARVRTSEEAIESHRSTIAELNRSRETLRTRIEAVETILDTYERIADLDAEIDRLRERRHDLEELNDERRDRLAEKRDRRRELEEHIDDDRIDAARTDLEKAVAYLERAEETRDSLQSKRDDVIDRIGGVQNELQELKALRERRDELATLRDAIETVHDEVDTLESLYGDLRTDLREQNLIALERMLNETFDLVYQNDAYERIELDREYRFTVYQKDGSTLDPSLLSGGERALFNLSLRCAIYRLLSEGIEGTAPLPPLILDEPTVYLDAGHVGQLVELVEAMRELGVEQIILVTHDPELLRAADTVLTVEKDPTTNRSSVTTTPATVELPTQD